MGWKRMNHRAHRDHRAIRRVLLCGLCVLCGSFFAFPAVASAGEVWNFKREFLPALVKAVPKILESQDKKTGKFGTGIWMVNDRHPMYPLAVAWAMKIDGVENPYYQSSEVLEAIMSAGDALIADQDVKGMWEF